MTETQASMMTEAQLQASVNGLLRFYGWQFFHAPDNRPVQARSGRRYVQHVEPGFPDVIAIRQLHGYGPELLIAELKKESGRYGPGQEDWLKAFGAFAAAVDVVNGALGHRGDPMVAVHTWRPSDLLDGTIDRVLCGPDGVNGMVGEA